MNGPPEIEITGGSPNPDEAEAIRRAVVALWREDQAKAAQRGAGAGGWVATARLEGVGAAASSARSWRAAAGLMQPAVLGARRVGRGDTR